MNHATKWLDPEGTTDTPIPVDPRTIQFTQLSVVYLGPKEPKTILIEKTAEAKTPNGATIKRKQPDVWSDKVCRNFLDPRLEGLEMALASYPEWPEGLESYPGFEGPASWQCPGPPLCYLPMCLAKRWPNGLTW